jgi:hypothetical protein
VCRKLDFFLPGALPLLTGLPREVAKLNTRVEVDCLLARSLSRLAGPGARPGRRNHPAIGDLEPTLDATAK